MLLVFSIVLASVIISFCFVITKNKPNIRIIIGLVLMFSLLSYPLSVQLFGEYLGLEGIASLMFFYFLLLVGGFITFIAGCFTKKSKDG